MVMMLQSSTYPFDLEVKLQFYVLFCSETIYALYWLRKTIYALRPESCCALKVAIRKVQTFWASDKRSCDAQNNHMPSFPRAEEAIPFAISAITYCGSQQSLNLGAIYANGLLLSEMPT